MTVYRQTIEADTGNSVPNIARMGNAAEDTGQKVARLDKQTEKLGDRAGKTATAAGMLGGALGRINPQLEDGARLVADLADSLDVATMVGGKFIPHLAIIGTAVAAAAGAYMQYKKALDDATDAMEKQAERASAMVELHRRVKEAALLAALAEGEITQAQFDSINASQTAADLFSQQRVAQRQELDAAQAALEIEQERLDTITATVERRRRQTDSERVHQQVNRDFIQQQERIQQNVNRLTQARNNAAQQLGQINVAQANYAENLRTVADVQNQTTDATNATTDAVKTGTEAIKQMTDQVLSLGEAFAVLGIGTPGGVGIGIDIGDPLSAQLGPMRDRLEMLQRQIEIRQRLQAMNQGGGGADVAGTIASALQVAGGNLSGVSGLLPAGMSGLAGALGPIGAIAGGLSAIGTMGAEGVEEKLEGITDSIAAGIRALPTILIDVIPEFVVALVTELPAAIADAIAELFRRLLNLIPGVNIKEPGAPPTQVNEVVTAAMAEQEELAAQAIGFVGVGGQGVNTAAQRSRSAAASTRGRIVRADGARRLAMSRAPTSSMLGQGATVIQQALGFDSGTQDRFQRRFSQLIDADTGLRGRA